VEKHDQAALFFDDRHAAQSPFSILARQKVATPGHGTQVDLCDLFQKWKIESSQIMNPKRILIRGRAGVGKTTLCKKIIHDFTSSTETELQRSWRIWFDRVLWVPLRNLKHRGRKASTYNYKNLFCDEYFCMAEKGKRTCLAQALCQTLEDTKSGRSRTLFLLDGLDEISTELGNGNGMSRFLEHLLGTTNNVIVTSRPNADCSALQDIHLELETVGFHPRQVDRYIKAVANPGEAENNQKTVDEIQSFLKDHWLMRGLVRIPIQLDALCYTWEDKKCEPFPETMTAIYNRIVQRLWRKDVARLDKLSARAAKDSFAAEIERDLGTEIGLVECLAFNGMYGDVVDFTPAHRAQLVKKVPDEKTRLDWILERLSFFRTSDSSSRHEHRDYHFIHPTFQEYFAAKYFVQKWTSGQQLEYELSLPGNSPVTSPTDPIKFLRKHKYSARYDVFWRFVVGFLDSESHGPEGPHRRLDVFFQTIEEEPLDLLGPTHHRLLMHCLSEVSSEVSCRSRVEKKISQWLISETNLNGYPLSVREPECPCESIHEALESTSGKEREAFLHRLSFRETQFSEPTVSLITSLFNNDDDRVRFRAVQALVRQSKLSEPALAAVMSRFRDHDQICGLSVTILQDQSSLSESQIIARTALLQDTDPAKRAAGAAALGCRLTLPEATINALIELSHDKYENVVNRCHAARALARKPELSEPIIVALTALLQDEESDIRFHTLRELYIDSNLPQSILLAIAGLLRDKNHDTQHLAMVSLRKCSRLPNEIIAKIATLVQDKETTVRCAAIEALPPRMALSDAILAGLTGMLLDEDKSVRYKVVSAIKDKSELPESIIDPIVELLHDDFWAVREAASDCLRNQSNLSKPTMTAITALLCDQQQHAQNRIPHAISLISTVPDSALPCFIESVGQGSERAVAVVQHQPTLSDAAEASIRALLEREPDRHRRCVIESLEGRSKLSEPTVAALIALFERDQNVQYAVTKLLGHLSNLSNATLKAFTAVLTQKERLNYYIAMGMATTPKLLDQVLDHIRIPPESNKQAGTDLPTFQCPEMLESLGMVLLKRSFSEQCSLYLDTICGVRVCIINQPGGLRVASLDESCTDDVFRMALIQSHERLETISREERRGTVLW
jgi:hypothetical protein